MADSIPHHMGEFWVFGYGSLIWRPGFQYEERCRALLRGLHRSLCVRSWVHRGTREQPGLVLGLDIGGSCKGVAMRVADHERPRVHQYLREREMVTAVYVEDWRSIELSDGRRVRALVYRVDRSHPQYAAGLSYQEQAKIVRRAQGKSGVNTDYVRSTVEAMRREAIRDHRLEKLDQLI